MDVFDRTTKYDPNIDAIVRVEARPPQSEVEGVLRGGAGKGRSCSDRIAARQLCPGLPMARRSAVGVWRKV